MALTSDTTVGQSTSPVSSPQSGTGGGAAPSTLAGDNASETVSQTGQMRNGQPGPDQGLKIVTQQVEQMQQTVTAIARQFPAAVPALRQVASGLRAAMRQIIVNPGSPEPPSPDVGG